MIPEYIEKLILKHLRGNASEKEVRELNDWYHSVDLSTINLPDISPEELKERGDKMRQNLNSYVHNSGKPRLFKGIWWQVAAVLLLFLGGGWIAKQLLQNNTKIQLTSNELVQYKPGHQGAILHLEGGKTIVLDSTTNGVIATDAGVDVVKDATGLRYSGKASKNVYNSITTQKGRIWSLVLPDGTKVWLNAASSIRFPLSFPKNERRVAITGEVYFEVVHNVNQPFRVEVGDQVIEDLGTSFNINAYGDNQNIITTLVEGSLSIQSDALNCVLVPGEQASVGKDNIVCKVNHMSSVTSWREGYFDFYEAGLKEVMQQISRWYDFDVEYKTGLTKEKFTGRIPKSLELSKALEILKQAGILFTLESEQNATAKKIIVLPF